MKISFKRSLLKVRHEKVRYIILHHTYCNYSVNPALKIDNSKLQVPFLNKEVMEKKQADVNYHFVVEMLGDEFYCYTFRPINTYCNFPDIHPDDNRSIHIAVLGNYDLAVPPKRLYEILSYRVIMPYMRIFNLAENRLKFHSELSDNKELTCPGDFMDKEIVISMIRRYLLK